MIMDTERARKTLSQVEDRHNEIIKLEKSILKVNKLFKELAEYVELQVLILIFLKLSYIHNYIYFFSKILYKYKFLNFYNLNKCWKQKFIPNFLILYNKDKNQIEKSNLQNFLYNINIKGRQS